MIVFRPFVGEIISAKLKESTADGLHCMFNSYFRISFVSIFSSFFDSTIFFYIAIFHGMIN
jgi:DNA-directed RNA polymerase subunit E'/Rpb7